MKLLTWNICHGGSKARMSGITQTLCDHNADVIILTEFRLPKGEAIQSALKDNGWEFQVTSDPPQNQNGLLITSKLPLALGNTANSCETIHRWLEVYIKEIQMTILAVHIPGAKDKWGKPAFWRSILSYASTKKNEPVMIIGDFNTGLAEDAEGTPFVCSECMIALQEMGWVDSWREMHGSLHEYTWYSNVGNGFRLDYAFLSPGMRRRLQNSCHSHAERERGLSDHSALIIRLK